MTVDLSVLDSLGINLYSNAAAVLSELVANSYDADATRVDITWNQGRRVVVSDDGDGMDVSDLNERFLKVGYRKRDEQGDESPKFHRPYMGRKGIGKLSVFSIADVVSVYSTKDGVTSAFRIDAAELRRKIQAGEEYEPTELDDVPDEYKGQGTTLVLDSLRSKRADLTAKALRKRLSRRFDVLDQTPPEEGGFDIFINGSRVTWDDRQELKKLQFIWEFGTNRLPDTALPSGVERFQVSGVVDETRGWVINGWFGTAKKPTDLTADEEAGSLKNIIVLARKRPIQEGIIEKLDFSQVFGNYVTGQIEADFLDDSGLDDIATSDRQRLIEDDERVVALQKFLRKAFLQAAETWSERRPKKEVPDVMDRYPKIREWVDGLDPYQKPYAEKMIGTISSLDFESKAEDQRVNLFRSGILAFARVGLRKSVEDLDALSAVTAEDILPILARQSEYEAALWVDILRSRVEAISQFKNITEANEKERVLQEHLFKNLWLLDASWERAAGSERMEQGLKRMFKEDFDLDTEQMADRGRVDIRYATSGGEHVVVELKRYDVSTDIDDLKKQGGRYAVALQKALQQQGHEDPRVEVVFVLGRPPRVTMTTPQSDDAYIDASLRQIGGRIVYYDALIENALKQYDEYLNASAQARDLEELLASIGAADPVSEDDAAA